MKRIESKKPLRCKSKSCSAIKAAGQYQSRESARRFAAAVPGTRTDRLEKKSIHKALFPLPMPPGSSVLDIPCGAGRLYPLLKKKGYRVTGADISAYMVQEAARVHYDRLEVADIFETDFLDKEFDLIICHRLFQYFTQADDRRRVLAELHRIANGPVIVSFSCNFAVDFLFYRIRRFCGLSHQRNCRPISFIHFARDAREAGLEVIRWIAARPFISVRWYAVMRSIQCAGAVRNPGTIFLRSILLPLTAKAGVSAAIIILLMYLYLRIG